MKKNLQKIFSALIITAMMYSASANAQIIYTDVNPDSTMYTAVDIGSNDYNLDLNNDGNNDFTLKARANAINTTPYTKSKSVLAAPLNGNAVSVNSNTLPIPLQFNAVINSNLLFNQPLPPLPLGWITLKDTVFSTSLGGSSTGLWNNLSDYYLGLRLLQSGQTYYGWVRLRVDVTSTYASLIVRDYAYNSIPNQPILAGQTVVTGVNENSFASSISLYPNPAPNQLTITLGSSTKNIEVTIADITGKIIYKTTSTDTQKLEVNTSEFAAGIYVVQIQTGDFIATKKLVIEK